MKRTSLFAPLLLSLPLAAGLVLTSFATTQEAVTPDGAPTQSAEQYDHKKFETHMKGLMRGQKAVRRLLKDSGANQAAILKTLEGMEKDVVAAYQLVPPRPEQELSDADWALYRLGFKAEMLETQAALLRMQMAAHRKDDEGLKKEYKALGDSKKRGHDKYKFD